MPEMMFTSQLLRIDAALCLRCNRTSRNRVVRWTFARVSRLGDGIFWYLLIGILLALDSEHAPITLLRMLIAGIGGVLIYKWLKRRTLRPRPYEVVPQIEAAAAPLDRFSFPSGHTLHAVSFSLIIAAAYPGLAPLVFPAAILVAMSRPVLGLHYPSDVLAGAAIGALVAECVLHL
jgi:undecaprenyl-diphosphatase